jgi:hypothetical protein
MTLSIQHAWVPILMLLLSTLNRTFKEEVTGFPTLAPTWRALIVSVTGILAGALEQVTTGGNFLNAPVVALITAGPSLATLIFDVVKGPKVPAS